LTEHSTHISILLAVDAGLTCGLAAFDIHDGQLLWYRSHNFGSLPRLRRGASSVVTNTPGVCAVIIEGGGLIAEAWRKAALHHRLPVECVSAERWRSDVLLPREQRRGSIAKKTALQVARKSIKEHARYQSKALRDDTAEAILLGEWALQRFDEIFPTACEPQKGEPDDFSA
jgi:hypothetical protein